jgi:hypothetical protein
MLLSRSTLLLAALLSLSTVLIKPSQAYLSQAASFQSHIHNRPASFLPSSATNINTRTSSTSAEDAFSAFADSLEEELEVSSEDKPWQAKLEDLLNPSTNLADRQILVSELLLSNADIQQSVMEALANRKVCYIVLYCIALLLLL